MTTFFVPPHEIKTKDNSKLAGLIESFRVGRAVPPIAAQGEIALTGSHRVAAHERAYRLWSKGAEGWEDSPEPVLESVEVSDEDYTRACQLIGVEHHDEAGEWNLFIAALYAVTEDESLKAALADQRHEYEDYTAADFERHTGA